MGWHVGIHTNTITMSLEAADILEETAADNWTDSMYDPKEGLYISPDAMEHIDYFDEEWALEVFKHPSVNGDIVFLSSEGDNAGSIWGYRFKNGVRKRLYGEIIIKEAK